MGRRSVLHEETSDGPGAVATYAFRRSRTARLFIDERSPVPKRLRVAFDDSPDGHQAVGTAIEIARATRYPLTVFHANPPLKTSRMRWCEQCSMEGVGLLRSSPEL